MQQQVNYVKVNSRNLYKLAMSQDTGAIHSHQGPGAMCSCQNTGAIHSHQNTGAIHSHQNTGAIHLTKLFRNSICLYYAIKAHSHVS